MNLASVVLAQAAAPTAVDPTYLVWGIVLLAVGAALFFCEILLPTGGVLGGLSATAVIAGVVMLFQVNTTLGLISTIVTLLAIPFLLMYALKLWPDTPFARWVILKDPEAAGTDGPHADRRGRGGGVREGSDAAALAVGSRGKTLTDLRPVGTCLLEGRREECFAHRGAMDRDTPVKVVRIEGGSIYVAPDDEPSSARA